MQFALFGSMARDKSFIILNRAVITEAGNDFAAFGVKIRLQKLGEAFVEELGQDYSSLVVGGFANFRLRVHL